MRTFSELYETAVQLKGTEGAVEALLPDYLSAQALRELSDSELLSTMSLRIFQAGLKHDLVAAKWPTFEAFFKGFNPRACSMLSDERLDEALSNRELIRHGGKLRAIRTNAMMMVDIAKQHGSFARFIAAWPVTDITSLWVHLKKHGAQLGGASASRFLRMVGKDTFILTDDVVTVLTADGVITKPPSARKDLLAAQGAFNEWHQQSGWPMCHISRLVSLTTSSR